MKIKSYIIFILLAFSLLTLGGLFVINNTMETTETTETLENLETMAQPYVVERTEGEWEITQSVLFDVPFTSQAPFGNWDNQVFQQACEEASMLMAMLWVEGKEFISKEDANKAILEISDFEEKNYGYFEDTSAEDTAIIMKDYFSYNNIEVLYDIGSQDIKRELANGSIVITPMNGQKVGNPFYTPPGPLRHMILVVGYDRETKEFITNDPGTRHGEGFRYKEDIFEAALQDYITGHKEPIDEIRSAMIVVRRISF